MDNLFSFIHYRHEPNSHIWIGFPEIGFCHEPKFFKCFYVLNSLWMNFPEIVLAHAPEIC